LSVDFFVETSFLFAAYRQESGSPAADDILADIPPGGPLSPIVVFEFENALSLHAGLFDRNRNHGLAAGITKAIRADFRADLDAGFWTVAPMDLPEVLMIAQKLSSTHTRAGLNRAMDILHVATALAWKTRKFLTFDVRQARLARAAGLRTPLPLES